MHRVRRWRIQAGSRSAPVSGRGQRPSPVRRGRRRIAAAIATTMPSSDQDVADAEHVGERQPRRQGEHGRSADASAGRPTTALFE